MARDVLAVIDMQVGLLQGLPKHDLDGVIGRINALAAAIRARGGTVVWIRHCGPPGDAFAPDAPGWAFLPGLDRQPADLEVEKTLNDAFAGTALADTLRSLDVGTLVIAGWATDFCVDATIRSAVSRGLDVAVASDAHTVSDRPHLSATDVIRHHNWVWSGLLSRRSLRVVPAAELAAG